jgi:four helix bundle protein
MNPEEFRKRTKGYALRVIRLVEALRKSTVGNVIGRQLLRCGTSVGANYRAASRAKSRADFIAKMKIVEEECDESQYWMELLIESGQVKTALLDDLIKEADEIVSLVVASIKTARKGKPNKRSKVEDR